MLKSEDTSSYDYSVAYCEMSPTGISMCHVPLRWFMTQSRAASERALLPLLSSACVQSGPSVAVSIQNTYVTGLPSVAKCMPVCPTAVQCCSEWTYVAVSLQNTIVIGLSRLKCMPVCPTTVQCCSGWTQKSEDFKNNEAPFA